MKLLLLLLYGFLFIIQVETLDLSNCSIVPVICRLNLDKLVFKAYSRDTLECQEFIMFQYGFSVDTGFSKLHKHDHMALQTYSCSVRTYVCVCVCCGAYQIINRLSICLYLVSMLHDITDIIYIDIISNNRFQKYLYIYIYIYLPKCPLHKRPPLIPRKLTPAAYCGLDLVIVDDSQWRKRPSGDLSMYWLKRPGRLDGRIRCVINISLLEMIVFITHTHTHTYQVVSQIKLHICVNLCRFC